MKHFLHLNDFSKQEIIHIFELADKLKANNEECDWLKRKTIVLFFPESSIRTRVSFEKGIKMLSGDTILFPPEALDKKEDISITLDGVFHGFDGLDNESIDLDFCWVPLEDLKKGTKVYPLELIPYILEPGKGIVHFVSKQI